MAPPASSEPQEAEPLEAEPLEAAAASVSERGSFAHARCAKCGWEGPARRSRDRARRDLDRHVADRPKHEKHTDVLKTR